MSSLKICLPFLLISEQNIFSVCNLFENNKPWKYSIQIYFSKLIRKSVQNQIELSIELNW